MKKIYCCIALLISTLMLRAQLPVPRFDVRDEQNYSQFNDVVLEYCNWLMGTPVNNASPYIDAVIVFLLEWSMQSPDVLILMDDRFMPYFDSHSQAMMWHIAGSSKYQLERGIYARERSDAIASTVAGIEAVIKYYETNRETIGPDKNIEKLMRLRDKGKLEKYVSKRIPGDIAPGDDEIFPLPEIPGDGI